MEHSASGNHHEGAKAGWFWCAQLAWPIHSRFTLHGPACAAAHHSPAADESSDVLEVRADPASGFHHSANRAEHSLIRFLLSCSETDWTA